MGCCFCDMSQSDQSVNAYQLRIVLRRTSPHLWRRVLVGSDSTLRQLHQVVQALFGWTDSHPHRFVLRGRSLGASSTASAAILPAAEVRLSEFKLLLKERFFYDYRFHDADVPIWRHEIRFEKALAADPERVPCCIGGVGNPPLEQSGSPQELSTLAELFTPPFVLHQLTELIDRGSSNAELATQLRYLRPWLTADRFQSETGQPATAGQPGVAQ